MTLVHVTEQKYDLLLIVMVYLKSLKW